MKEAWQKILVSLLVLAILAAATVGQRGIKTGGTEGEMREPGQGEEEMGTDGNKGEGTDGEERTERTGRKGKLLTGWEEPPCIVIDAGHGGYDPGKMGVGMVAEKDVNLSVAKLLKDDLEACGVKVVMTREEDRSLCEEGEERAKVRDLKNRIRIIEEADPVAVVSVHQNSYPEESVHGAQVFYYVNSVEGKDLAEAIQARLISELDPDNGRQVKGNDSYYLLKKTSVPLVIAECGFLSNPEEAGKLSSKAYQEDVAWALYLGIMDYLEKK